jgi:hypothetical protein
MYWKPNTTDVHIKKDFLGAKEMIQWVHENINLEDVLVIHFRLATHGLKDIGNRHPFPITKNTELLRKPELVCQIAVAHNGVLANYGHHAKFSDTQKFVLDILSDECIKNNIESEGVQKLISSFIDGDKLAILRNDGVCYRFGEWVKNDGIFYSNDGYKPYSWVREGFNNIRDWRSDYETRDSFISQQETKLLNCSVNKNMEKTKDAAWVSECDGCHEKKFVRYVEINDNAFVLCKKCRRDYKKGRLKLGGVEEIEAEQICDSCGEFSSEKELIDIALDGGMKICTVCHMAYIENGNILPNY